MPLPRRNNSSARDAVLQSHAQLVFLNRFFHPDHSATSQILTDLATGLARNGMNVSVVTSRQLYQDAAASLERRDSVQGVKISRLWGTKFGRSGIAGRAVDYLSFYASVILWLLVNVRRGDTVVCMTDPPLLSVAGYIARKLRGASYVNWLQDLFPDTAQILGVAPPRPVLRLLEVARDKSIAAARANVVLGERMAERVHSHVPAGRTIVVHNWALGDEIRPVAAVDNPLRREWNLQDRFVVGYSGNMGRAHEFGAILDAAEALRHDQIIFVLVGDGAQKPFLESEVRRRNLDNVVFKPYQPRERLSESLSVPDVHLVSLQPELEGCIVPSKFYGIAAAGRATVFIGDPDGEIARIVRKHRCGVTVSSKATASLVSQLRSLSDDRELCNEMGRAARRVYEQDLSFTRALSQWRALLNES